MTTPAARGVVYPNIRGKIIVPDDENDSYTMFIVELTNGEPLARILNKMGQAGFDIGNLTALGDKAEQQVREITRGAQDRY